MNRILHIISSPRREHSFSIRLAEAIVQQLLTVHPDAEVQTLDLTDPEYPQVDEIRTKALRTPGQQTPEENEKVLALSDQSIEQLKAADCIVIGAPIYNLGVSTFLKAWIDHVCRAGHTFRFTESGFDGLIKGKKVYLAIASGGVYSQGPMVRYDFVEPYLRTVLGFMGMTDISVFRVEGVDIPGIQETSLEQGISSIRL